MLHFDSYFLSGFESSDVYLSYGSAIYWFRVEFREQVFEFASEGRLYRFPNLFEV